MNFIENGYNNTTENVTENTSGNALPNFWDEAEVLGQALRERLDYWEALGVTQLPASLAPPLVATAYSTQLAPSGANHQPMPPGVNHQPMALADAQLSQIPTSPDVGDHNHNVAQCHNCELSPAHPPQPPAHQGGEHPYIVLVGPYPSIYTPPALETLTKMMINVLELEAEQYHFTTVLKCSPTEEALATSESALACRPVLIGELKLLQPHIVLAMGELAAQTLSGSRMPLGLLRPMTHEIKELPGMWLRNTYGLEHFIDSVELKREVWADLLKIKSVLPKLLGRVVTR